MTDNNIIKVLEYCTTDGWCANCPHEKKCIEDEITQLALDLINRQKAEIERLKTENLILSQKRINFFERIEIITAAEVRAVKEFAERLKDKITMSPHSFISIDKWYIDNLVKEMVGENNVPCN